MSNRHRLPDRRGGDTIKVVSECRGGMEFNVTTGRYPDGRLGDFFVHCDKVGSDVDAATKEFAAAVSIGLQHGAGLELYAENMQRDTSGKPLTIQGEILDSLMRERG